MSVFKAFSDSKYSRLSEAELQEMLSQLKRKYAFYLLKLSQLEAKNKILKASKELEVIFKRPNKADSILAIISGNWSPPLEIKVIIIESSGGYVENGTTVKTNSPIITMTDLNVGNHYGLTIHVLDSTGKRFITTAGFNYTLPDSCELNKTEFSDTESVATTNIAADSVSANFVMNILIGNDKLARCEWNVDDNYTEVAENFVKQNKLKPILMPGLIRLMEQQVHSATHSQQVDLADLIIV